ncbi:MAG: hypothetical protein IPK26_13155 [Planctomycetes bacterium]|nr:hypothetical protein [Planctomycetota bacterium]
MPIRLAFVAVAFVFLALGIWIGHTFVPAGGQPPVASPAPIAAAPAPRPELEHAAPAALLVREVPAQAVPAPSVDAPHSCTVRIDFREPDGSARWPTDALLRSLDAKTGEQRVELERTERGVVFPCVAASGTLFRLTYRFANHPAWGTDIVIPGTDVLDLGYVGEGALAAVTVRIVDTEGAPRRNLDAKVLRILPAAKPVGGGARTGVDGVLRFKHRFLPGTYRVEGEKLEAVAGAEFVVAPGAESVEAVVTTRVARDEVVVAGVLIWENGKPVSGAALGMSDPEARPGQPQSVGGGMT